MIPVSTSLWSLAENNQWKTLRYNRSPHETKRRVLFFQHEHPHFHGFIDNLSLVVLMLPPLRQIHIILVSRIMAILIDIFQMISSHLSFPLGPRASWKCTQRNKDTKLVYGTCSMCHGTWKWLTSPSLLEHSNFGSTGVSRSLYFGKCHEQFKTDFRY